MRAKFNKRADRYQCVFKDKNGKRITFTSAQDFPKGLTEAEADKIANEIYETYWDEVNKKTRPLIKDLVSRQLNEQEQAKVKGMERLRDHANRALTWAGNKTIDEIVDVTRSMYLDLIDRRKPNGEPLKGSYIKKMLDPYTQVANKAFMEWDILDLPVSQKMPHVVIGKGRTRHLTHQEAQTLINGMEGEAKHIVIFMILTGIRNAELRRLTPENFNNGVITIDGKTGSLRSFRMNEECIDALNNIEFPIKTSYRIVYDRFVKSAKEAGIKNIMMHDLRHTFASWIAQTGNVHINQLKEVMGHSNISQTAKYSHFLPEHLDSVVANISINEFKQKKAQK